MDWLGQHRVQLVAALLPESFASVVPASAAPTFARHLHLVLAAQTAERLRRREALIAASQPAPAGPGEGVGGLLRPCPLPLERQLSVADLRDLERRGRQAVPVQVAQAVAAPPSGEPRRVWLRRRLVQLLREETEVCPASAGATAQELLEFFETRTGETFSANPGALLTSRVRALAKVMGNITKEETFDPLWWLGGGGRWSPGAERRGLHWPERPGDDGWRQLSFLLPLYLASDNQWRMWTPTWQPGCGSTGIWCLLSWRLASRGWLC